ncbi:MAG: cbb3-type cytochrome oxidase assembly protein CcoS [Thiobacillaceae bacterium]
MDILFLLIPLGLVLVALIAWFFLWSVKSGQFDDLEGPGHTILMDDDRAPLSRGRSDEQMVIMPSGETDNRQSD